MTRLGQDFGKLLRGLAVVTALLNLALAAMDAVLVLFVQERLGLGEVGFGLLLTVTAVGALAGSAVTARLTRRFGESRAYVLAVVLLAAALAGLGGTRSPAVAAVALGVVGLGITLGNVILQSLRQVVTPAHLLGRVVSAYRLVGMGSIPLGALAGGLLGRVDLRLPYLTGAALVLLAGVGATALLRGGAVEQARTDAAEADAVSAMPT